MNSVINFVEIENQVISATYRNLMFGATVVLVDNRSGQQLSEPVVRITSRLPVGSIRIRLSASIKAGTYFLRALNAHGSHIAQSHQFDIA
ncbi:MAG: hypothetical protein U1E61_08230 [Bradyrhizobium sp.]